MIKNIKIKWKTVPGKGYQYYIEDELGYWRTGICERLGLRTAILKEVGALIDPVISILGEREGKDEPGN